MNNQQRLRIYEQFFHKINLHCITMNTEKIKDAIGLIDSWSYSHRVGNGTFTEKEQRKIIDSAIKRMEEF
jgi:hypothetical protein